MLGVEQDLPVDRRWHQFEHDHWPIEQYAIAAYYGSDHETWCSWWRQRKSKEEDRVGKHATLILAIVWCTNLRSNSCRLFEEGYL